MNQTWLQSLFEAIKALFDFTAKAIPPDVIRIDKEGIAKPRLTAEEKTKIYDIAYNRLKNHTEIDIATDVKYNYGSLSEDDQKELTKLLIARITEYRKRHPIIFKKWLSLQCGW